MAAAFGPTIISVGTSPVLILANHGRRLAYNVVFPSSAKIAANTGIIYIGIGFPPVATGGNASQGHSMANGEQFGEATLFAGDQVSQEALYAIASTTGQTIEVYETVLPP